LIKFSVFLTKVAAELAHSPIVKLVDIHGPKWHETRTKWLSFLLQKLALIQYIAAAIQQHWCIWQQCYTAIKFGRQKEESRVLCPATNSTKFRIFSCFAGFCWETTFGVWHAADCCYTQQE